MIAIALVLPAPALAASTSESRSASPPRSAGGDDTVLLARGSGYAGGHGSQLVRVLQRRLMQAGYAPGPVDGRYGPLTEQAVIGFQRSHGLVMDGIVGRRTSAALGHSQLVLGPGAADQGHGAQLVSSLQRRLARAGYRPGPIDGRYGSLTASAVRRFQVARGLAASGTADPRTLERLGLTRQPRRSTLEPPRRVKHYSARKPAPPARRSVSRPRAAVPPKHTSASRAHAPAPAAHAPASPAHNSSRQVQHSSPPAGVQRQSPGGGSSSTPWLVIIGVAGVALVLMGLMYAHRRRRPHAAGPAAAPPPASPPPASPQAAPRAPSSSPSASPRADSGPPAPPPAAPPPAAPLPAATPAAARPIEGSESEANNRNVDWDDHPAVTTANGSELPANGSELQAATAQFARGLRLERQGDLNGAQAAFHLADHGGHAAAAAHLGALFEEQGELGEAEAAHRRADERGDPAGAFHLGVLLVHRGRLAEAEEACRRADARGHAGAATNLGVLLEERGALDEAEAAYRRADRRGDAAGAFNLGALLEERGALAEAQAAYRRADERGEGEVANMASNALRDLRDLLERTQQPSPTGRA